MASGAAAQHVEPIVEEPSKPNDLSSRRAEGTLTDVVEGAVREAIISGIYRPGQKLSITTIAREQSVSLSVMREALTRLAADGLVTSVAMQGFSVMRTSIADLNEITALLKLLVTTAVSNSVVYATPEWEASLIAANHLFKRAVAGEIMGAPRSAEVDRAHTLFMNTLISNCGSARLIGFLKSLQQSMRLYHRLAIGLLKNEAHERVATCWKVTQCAIDGNADEAIRLMTDDIETATAACRAYLSGDRGNIRPRRQARST